MAHIAVLEDDDAVRELVQEVLGERGHTLMSFGRVGAAREGLAQTKPDLLITDLRLPDGNGLDLVAALRRESASLPVLVLSGLTGEQDFEAGFEAGATDYITKPFSTPELAAKCARILAKQSSQSAAAVNGAELLPGGQNAAFGRYRIKEQLGTGGGGTVFLAEDKGDGKLVALKVLHPFGADDEVARQRFVRESYSLALVDDPHVVRVHDFGTEEGRSFFAMERVEGPTLRERVSAQGPLSEAQCIEMLIGLAQALGALSDVGLVHRDVKPANVILRGGSPLRPVLVDFGLAKRPGDHLLTKQGDIVGTPAFMSPDVIHGAEPSSASDIFSLGLTALHALTGREPFPGQRSALSVMHAIASQPVPIPAVSPALREVLRRMTRIDLEQRYRDPNELLRDLTALRHQARSSCASSRSSRSSGLNGLIR